LIFLRTDQINKQVPYKKGTYPNFRQRPLSDIAY